MLADGSGHAIIKGMRGPPSLFTSDTTHGSQNLPYQIYSANPMNNVMAKATP
jgi:hypothetical protein